MSEGRCPQGHQREREPAASGCGRCGKGDSLDTLCLRSPPWSLFVCPVHTSSSQGKLPSPGSHSGALPTGSPRAPATTGQSPSLTSSPAESRASFLPAPCPRPVRLSQEPLRASGSHSCSVSSLWLLGALGLGGWVGGASCWPVASGAGNREAWSSLCRGPGPCAFWGMVRPQQA